MVDANIRIARVARPDVRHVCWREGADVEPEAGVRGRVLVVEDTAELREAIAQLLRDEGHEVGVAANGREALEVIVREGPFDVALVDLLMPEIDGPSLVTRLRGDSALARMRVVVVTAVASPHIPRLVRADAHIFKPFDARELLDTVQALLAPPASFGRES